MHNNGDLQNAQDVPQNGAGVFKEKLSLLYLLYRVVAVIIMMMIANIEPSASCVCFSNNPQNSHSESTNKETEAQNS